MANNFKLTGDYYVSVDGSDANSGLTKDLPKRTIQAGLNLMTTANKVLIIGAGVYNESISKSWGSGIHYNIYGDGKVILDGAGKTWAFSHFGSNQGVLSNLEFKNYTSGVNIASPGIVTYSDCIFYCNVLGVITGGAPTRTFVRCVFLNSTICASSTISVTLSSCILMNSEAYGLSVVINTYTNPASILRYSASLASTYNNIQGWMIFATASAVVTGVIQDIAGRYYDLSLAGSGGSGTALDPFKRTNTLNAPFYFAEQRIAYPSHNAASFSSDPQFNNAQGQNFTLQANSPHILAASDGINNIGSTRYAIHHAALGDAFNTSAISVTDLEERGNDWIIDDPATTGEVISAPMVISNLPKVIQAIRYNGLLDFNKAIAGGATGNRNVPDQTVGVAATQEANPDRLNYYMRFSTQTDEPTVDAEWDNDGLFTAGTYQLFEWNTKPFVDLAGIGNGDPTLTIADAPTYIEATWIQMKVKLRNDYL
jgi:hypothetical protein